MTTFKHKRCTHCGTHYYYQGSGEGCLDDLNNPPFCMDCKNVIKEALSKVPIKFEFRYVDIKELGPEYQYITKEKIIEWNRDFEDGKVGLWFIRIGCPLFDIKDPSNIEKMIIIKIPEGKFKGLDAEYRYWSKKTEWDNIRVKVEWDLINNTVANV